MIPGNPMKPELGRVGALRRIPRGVRGIGLIEVMVSVLVLAVGLLGIAAMQSLALRGGQGSLESSQAVMQTNVMGSWNVLQAAQENGVRRVVFFSSINAQGSVKGFWPN